MVKLEVYENTSVKVYTRYLALRFMTELRIYPTIDQRQRFETGLYNVPLAFPAIATFRPRDVAHPVAQHIPKPAWYS